MRCSAVSDGNFSLRVLVAALSSPVSIRFLLPYWSLLLAWISEEKINLQAVLLPVQLKQLQQHV
jgi:hypothetical protein